METPEERVRLSAVALDPPVPTTLLMGVVGSTAYGLSSNDSDVDLLGVAALPNRHLLGLTQNPTEMTWVTTKPDSAVHELGKFARLSLTCNPTVMELLWLDAYTVESEQGRELVGVRSAFLSEARVRSSYAGYVKSQAKRVRERAEQGLTGFDSGGGGRIAKHGRHCARLLLQGRQLLVEGHLTVHLGSQSDHVVEVGNLAESNPTEFSNWAASEAAKLETLKSQLPIEPDDKLVEDVVVSIRCSFENGRSLQVGP